MNGNAWAGLVGRELVAAIRNASVSVSVSVSGIVTGIVTGISWSGLTSVLRATGNGCPDTDGCVVAGAPAERGIRLPLSDLVGLPVPLPNLPWFVDRIAQDNLAVAGGRRVCLLLDGLDDLDDLDAADVLSLSVLPLLQRRLEARLIATARAPVAAGLHLPDLDVLAGVLGSDRGQLAETIDALTAEGLLVSTVLDRRPGRRGHHAEPTSPLEPDLRRRLLHGTGRSDRDAGRSDHDAGSLRPASGTPDPLLAIADRTLLEATHGTRPSWSAAWQRWQEVHPGDRGPREAVVRAMAGWGSRSELLAVLHGRPGDGPVEAFLTGDWDTVEEAGLVLLAGTGRPTHPYPPSFPQPPSYPQPFPDRVGNDELVGVALAMLVALHRRQGQVVRALARQLITTSPGRRPPLVGYALAAAARHQRDLGEAFDTVQQDLPRLRRTGPRNGLDLLLFAAARLDRALGRPAGARALAGELDELAGELGTTRAEMLAARMLLAVGNARLATDRLAADHALDRLRSCLAEPSTEVTLGALARAETMVVVAERLRPADPEVVALATQATELLTSLQAGHWLARARVLLPPGATSGTGARSRATAEQVRRLIGEGLTNRQICLRLNLSEKSVKGYVTRLLRAHQCVNRAESTARRRRSERIYPA